MAEATAGHPGAQTSTCSGDVCGWKTVKMRRETTGPSRRVPFLPRMGYSRSARKASLTVGSSGPRPADARATASKSAPGEGCTPTTAFAISSETPGSCISCETHVSRTLSAGSFGRVWQRTPATLKREGVRLRRLSATAMAHCTAYSAAWAASRTSTAPTSCRSRQEVIAVAASGLRLAGLAPCASSRMRDGPKGRGSDRSQASSGSRPAACLAAADASAKSNTTGNSVPTASMGPATPASGAARHRARWDAYGKLLSK
mmetsp:Transcript_129985/g.404322  ORF Transcript_129985/g.404322 Transcript_129985/m.404322 type:complete len:259 (+) Transcript_129985:2-778(+)